MSSRTALRINKRDKKMMGLCAGLADHFDIDVTLVRVAMVIALLVTFPIVGFAYLALALALPSGPAATDYREAPRLTPESVEATRARMRELDQRMQAIETQVTTTNTSLAREIDALR